MFPTRWALVMAVVSCVIVPCSLVIVHIHENPQFSPIDELTHWDYVTRLANGGFPRLGDRLQPSTREEAECLKTASKGYRLPPCGSGGRIRAFGNGAYQYEAQQPPGYYAVTVPLRWFDMDILGMGDVTATRAPDVVWLAAALLMLWAAGRQMGLAPEVIGAGSLLIGTAPLVIYTNSYVSNDVPSLFAGSLVLLLGVLTLTRPGRWMAPGMFAAGAVVAAFKLFDLLVSRKVESTIYFC